MREDQWFTLSINFTFAQTNRNGTKSPNNNASKDLAQFQILLKINFLEFQFLVCYTSLIFIKSIYISAWLCSFKGYKEQQFCHVLGKIIACSPAATHGSSYFQLAFHFSFISSDDLYLKTIELFRVRMKIL